MANDRDNSNLFNPMMFWTDMGMRALEMTLSSTQNIGEGLDRLTRAGADASVETIENAEMPRGLMRDKLATDANSPMALAAQMQQVTFDLMTQAWQQWMNTLGALVAMGAGRSFGETVARQNPLVNAMREGMQWGRGDAAASAGPGDSAGRQGRGRSVTRPQAMEHGLARAEPKRRSRGPRAKANPRARSS